MQHVQKLPAYNPCSRLTCTSWHFWVAFTLWRGSLRRQPLLVLEFDRAKFSREPFVIVEVSFSLLPASFVTKPDEPVRYRVSRVRFRRFSTSVGNAVCDVDKPAPCPTAGVVLKMLVFKICEQRHAVYLGGTPLSTDLSAPRCRRRALWRRSLPSRPDTPVLQLGCASAGRSRAQYTRRVAARGTGRSFQRLSALP